MISGASGLQFPYNSLLKTRRTLLRSLRLPVSLEFLTKNNKVQAHNMYSKYGFRSLWPPVPLQFLIKKQEGNCSGSLRPPVSFEFLIKNKKVQALNMYSKYGFWSLGPPVPLQFLIKSNKEITPEASGASGFLFPHKLLLKTLRKILRKPSEL